MKAKFDHLLLLLGRRTLRMFSGTWRALHISPSPRFRSSQRSFCVPISKKKKKEQLKKSAHYRATDSAKQALRMLHELSEH